MDDYPGLSFSIRERFGADKLPTVVERRVALQIESGDYGLNNRYWERSASVHVKNALEKFDNIDEETIMYLMNETERMPDILNLNAGMTAAAQVFFQRSMNQFSRDLFYKFSPEILRTIVDNNLMTGSTSISSRREDTSDPEKYTFELWKYILRIGIYRGIFKNLQDMILRFKKKV